MRVLLGKVAATVLVVLAMMAPQSTSGNAEVIRKNGSPPDPRVHPLDRLFGADSWFDGDALFKLCTAPNERSKNLCHGYLMATADSYNSSGEPWKSCIVKGTGVDLLEVLFINHLRKHPALGNMTASDTVALLLRDTFPCPPK